MLTGRRIHIVDPEISAAIRPDEMLVSAVLTIARRSFLVGTASHALPCDWRFDLREQRLDRPGAPWPPAGVWRDWEGDVFNSYRKAYDDRPTTSLHTAETAREPVHLRWQVTAPFVDALERLRPLTECYGDEEALDEENGPDGDPHMLLTWYEPGPLGEDDWRPIGYLYLDEGRLAADVPTPAADRLIAEVAARAGDVTTLIERRPCEPRQIHDRQSALLRLDARGPGSQTRPTRIH